MTAWRRPARCLDPIHQRVMAGPGQLSVASQPVEGPPTLPGRPVAPDPFLAGHRHWEPTTDTAYPSCTCQDTPVSARWGRARPSLLPPAHMHAGGAQFSRPSQIQTKLRILPVSAVYHFEIYTILAERTELYCIHDAIKHFTRNQCKTDEA